MEWIDAGERFVMRITGTGALKFAHDMLSQDLLGLKPGQGSLATLLNEKGRLHAIVRVLVDEDGVVLDSDMDSGANLEASLVRIAPLAGAETKIETARLFHLTADAFDLGDEYSWKALDGGVAVRVRWGGDGTDVVATTWSPEGEQGSFEDLERRRIGDVVPRFKLDVDETTLVNESPLVDRAVSFTKGCYPGQESVARVRNLGEVRRFLRLIRLEGSPPTRGSAVGLAGTVTSSVSFGDTSEALAMLRSDTGPGAHVMVDDRPAAVLR